MKKVSTINLNLLTEKLYLEGVTNSLYENISNYGVGDIEASVLMEGLMTEEKNKDMLRDLVNDLKLAPKLIFTFGSGITAFYGPIKELLSGGGLNITEENIILLTLTSLCLLTGQPDVKKLVGRVKEEGLYPTLKGVNNFISETKDLLNSIVKNTLGVSHSLLDILGFTFLLVPTMDTISKLIGDYGLTIGNVNTLFTGLLLSIVTYSVKAVINKIKDRFN
tara:strand:+ start:182 stop:844 length:663 start_codon:yes stop_codon:yes gene_type:complete